MGTQQHIAFMGVAGAHSDLACKRAYPYMHTLPCPSFKDVFAAVESKQADIGMIPVGNNYAGRVAEIHNLLRLTDLHIVGEYMSPIAHHLMAKKGTKLEEVQKVASHPQALMQCEQHLSNMGLEPLQSSNTAVAAQEVAEGKGEAQAVLASELAAELYGLEILQRDMQDVKDNATLFLAISAIPNEVDPVKDAPVLTSVIFTTRNIPAGLYKSLGGFATNNVNIVKLESYIPEGNSDRAEFFITVEGHPDERHVQLALEELGFFSDKIKVLGVYPADKKRYK